MTTQQRILDFITRHIGEKGYPPTFNEIMKAVNLKSTSTVHQHLVALEKKGFIKRSYPSPRAIELVVKQDDSVKVVKVHKNVPSVIEWQGKRYIYDPFG